MPLDPGQAYYYAGGQRVTLGSCDLVAVDLDKLTDVTADAREELRSSGRPLTGAVVLVDTEVAERVLGAERLAEAPGVHPVYEAEDALLVVLPEVRVEGTAETLARVQRDASGRASVEKGEERLVLHPRTQRGEDALALANEFAEAAGSEELDLAQARFLRVTSRPDPRR